MPYDVPQKLLSWDEACQLYPGQSIEIYDGVVHAREAAPFAPHQRVVLRLGQHLANYLDDHPGTGEAFVAPFDVKLRIEAPALVLQPDVLFVAAARATIVDEFLSGAPDLVVEVVSASSARTDTIYKRNIYAHFGVPEYWVVWPDEHKVDVLRLVGELYVEALALGRGDVLTTPLLPGLALPVDKLFKA